MIRCPFCTSTNVGKNHLDNKHGAANCYHGSHAVGPLVAGAVWLLKKAVDAVQDTYKCKSCGKTFS